MSAVANKVITKGLHTHGTTEKRRLINQNSVEAPYAVQIENGNS